MNADPDFAGLFLALLTTGVPMAIIGWLAGLYLMQREDHKQQGQQRAREFRQNKQRLRIRRGNS